MLAAAAPLARARSVHANGPEFSRTRVKQRARQVPQRPQTKTGNNRTLDQRVGCNEWLGRSLVFLWPIYNYTCVTILHQCVG